MLTNNNKIVKPHTIKSLLDLSFLALKGISASPELDGEIILLYVIGKNREYLFTYPEKNISKKEATKFKNLINQRIKNKPIAYIIGHKEFYGLSFKVNKNTLIPRPETELMVDKVLEIINKKKYTKKNISLIDIGTGSGCIPIAIVKNLNRLIISACGIDISKKALKLARENARINKLGKYIDFIEGDLLTPVSKNFIKENNYLTIITANLPYLPEAIYKKCSADVKDYEPKNALIAGKDGLKYYRKLFKQIATASKPPLSQESIILCEFDPSQTITIKNLAQRYFPKTDIEIKKDLAGIDRLATIFIKK